MKKALSAILASVVLVLTASADQEAFAMQPTFDKNRTAIVITDPQRDFLSSDGKLFGLVKDNMERLDTINNIEALMKASKRAGIKLAVDPLVFTKVDLSRVSAGVLQRQLMDMRALYSETMSETDFIGSGADFYEPFKKYIHDGETIIVAPHKMYGPESNDLVYQLRSRGIETVILGGLVANLCVDSHMRALMEDGFNVFVVKDAVAAPGEEAYNAALVNYGMVASGVLTTKEALAAID